MTQSLIKQIADLKKRIEATKGTPAEATFQDILNDLEKQLAQGQTEDKAGKTPAKTATAKTATTKTATTKTTTTKTATTKTATTKAKAKNVKETSTENVEVPPLELLQPPVPPVEVITPPEKTQKEKTKATSAETEKTQTEETQTEETEKKKKDSSKPKNFFQAVGLIRGAIRRKEDQSGWYVEQGQNQYDLALSKKIQYVIRFVEGKDLTLTVYPQVRYEKGDRESCKIYFKLVGWSEERSANEGLFTIKGIWQFIPQYKRPVISVYRNQKQWDGDRCKAGHIPVLWKDSPVKPFKFNPKAETQGEKYFAQVQAKFIPRLNTFGVVSEMDESTLKVPKYIKPIRTENSDLKKSDDNADSQSDSKAKYKSKAKESTESASSETSEVKKVFKLKLKTEATTETNDVTTEVNTEVKTEVTEVAPEVNTEVKTEVTEVVPEVNTEVKTEVTEVVPEVKAKSKAKSKAKTEVKAEETPEVASEVASEVTAEVTAEVTPEPKTKAKTTRAKTKK